MGTLPDASGTGSTSKGRRDTPLRVGLLVDSFVQPCWIHTIISSIKASHVAEIVLIVKNSGNAREAGHRTGRIYNYWINRKQLLYSLYSKLDEYLSKVEPDAFKPMDISSVVADCPLIEITPIRKRFSDYFTDSDVEQILTYNLDVLLRFGFRIIRGRALNMARFGIWSYHHGDNLTNRGGPAGFWEVMERAPVSGAILQILGEDLDNGTAIYRGWSPTVDKYSVKRNRNNYYWKSSAFVMRKLTELYNEGEAALTTDSYQTKFVPYCQPLYRAPGNGEMLPLLGRLVKDYVRDKISHLIYDDQWILAYRFKTHAGDLNASLYKYSYLTPGRDRFWADPFPLAVRDKYFIFFEEYIYKQEKAHISVIELDRAGNICAPVKALERGYHLSYPFIFQWRGDYYMLPETVANGSVEIYRSASDIGEWRLEKVLMEGVRAADATLHEIEGRWWMFVSMTVAGGRNWDELYLFYADSPLGPWRAHKKNPIKTDVRCARPAGRLFYWHNELYRPAQDCSRLYGYAITLNRVKRLTPVEYEEEEISKLVPGWRPDIIGVHTINSADDLTVIDCLVKRRRYFNNAATAFKVEARRQKELVVGPGSPALSPGD